MNIIKCERGYDLIFDIKKCILNVISMTNSEWPQNWSVDSKTGYPFYGEN